MQPFGLSFHLCINNLLAALSMQQSAWLRANAASLFMSLLLQLAEGMISHRKGEFKLEGFGVLMNSISFMIENLLTLQMAVKKPILLLEGVLIIRKYCNIAHFLLYIF